MDFPPRKRDQGIYHFGEFKLDASERRLWCDAEPIQLSPKQFELLFYFVGNAGRVTSKADLLDTVWKDTFIEETTLARNVSLLRQKLGEYSTEGPIIETVPKFGYRFKPEVTRPEESLLIIEEETVQYTRNSEVITVKDEPLALTTDKKPFKYFSLPVLSVLFVVVSLLAGGAFLLYRNQRSGHPGAGTLGQATALNVKATIAVKNITVDATREAVDVGLKIQPGDVIRVSAMGIHQPQPGQTWTFQGEANGEISDRQIFPKADPWSLVAWIGNESNKTDYFQVSTNPAFQAKSSGSLYLTVNDLVDGYADNRGGLTVAVILYRQYNIFAEDDDAAMAWGKELVNIHKSDTLEIRSRGNVSYWQNGELYDLDGSDHSTIGHLVPDLKARSFIAKIGDNPPFKAGKDFPAQKVSTGGWLFLSVNDRIFNWSGSYRNNSGEISTDVEVVRQPEELKRPT